MAPKAPSLARFAAALVFLAAAVVVQLETAAAQDDACVELDLICKADAECLACKEVVGKNLDGYEQCIKYYGYEEDVCINQSAQPCCQNEASTSDCLANVAYVDFYECRLEADVFGGECTVLSCDAVGALLPGGNDDGTTDADADATDADADGTTDAVATDDGPADADATDDGATDADATDGATDADPSTDADAATDTTVDRDLDGEDDADTTDLEASATENGGGRLAPSSFLASTTTGKAGAMMMTAGLSVAAVVAAALV